MSLLVSLPVLYNPAFHDGRHALLLVCHKLKQLFSDVVHLNQRGLAILLRRIISFLPRSQRQLPHTKLTRQQRPEGDNVKSACPKSGVGLTTNARSPQGQLQSQPQRFPPVTSASLPCRYQPHEIVHQSAPLLSTGNTQVAHQCRTVVLL